MDTANKNKKDKIIQLSSCFSKICENEPTDILFYFFFFNN